VQPDRPALAVSARIIEMAGSCFISSFSFRGQVIVITEYLPDTYVRAQHAAPSDCQMTSPAVSPFRFFVLTSVPLIKQIYNLLF
jgi:hypothetical protein